MDHAKNRVGPYEIPRQNRSATMLRVARKLRGIDRGFASILSDRRSAVQLGLIEVNPFLILRARPGRRCAVGARSRAYRCRCPSREDSTSGRRQRHRTRQQFFETRSPRAATHTMAPTSSSCRIPVQASRRTYSRAFSSASSARTRRVPAANRTAEARALDFRLARGSPTRLKAETVP
jgi:hypothetical protein